MLFFFYDLVLWSHQRYSIRILSLFSIALEFICFEKKTIEIKIIFIFLILKFNSTIRLMMIEVVKEREKRRDEGKECQKFSIEEDDVILFRNNSNILESNLAKYRFFFFFWFSQSKQSLNDLMKTRWSNVNEKIDIDH